MRVYYLTMQMEFSQVLCTLVNLFLEYGSHEAFCLVIVLQFNTFLFYDITMVCFILLNLFLRNKIRKYLCQTKTFFMIFIFCCKIIIYYGNILIFHLCKWFLSSAYMYHTELLRNNIFMEMITKLRTLPLGVKTWSVVNYFKLIRGTYIIQCLKTKIFL